MKKWLGSFGIGLFAALVAGYWYQRRSLTAGAQATDSRRPDSAQIAAEMRDTFVPGKVDTGNASPELFDLNSCSVEDLLGITGMDADSATRIVESRPYRSKMDLLSQMVVPNHVFAIVSERVRVLSPDESVKIA